ncbi:MAG: hypothetical protein NC127_02530 [Muribaculum sp.]|nr:hypothetical protein [Muribaculum sp.]
MKLLLTKAQLLKEWQLRSFPEPVNSGCEIVSTAGVDIEGYISAKMDDWYRNLLASAPFELLAPVELARSVRVELSADGSARFQVPDYVVRLVSLSLVDIGPVPLVADLRGVSALTSGRGHHYRRSCQTAVALIDGNSISIRSRYPFSSAPFIASLMAIVDVEGEYRLDSRALSGITPESLY